MARMNKAQKEIITLLTAKVTDPNSTGRSGKNWIYQDKPRNDLTSASYPRIGVITRSEYGEPIGTTSTKSIDEVMLDIVIRTLRRQVLTFYDSESLEGPDLALKIARKCDEALRQNWRSYDLLHYRKYGIVDHGEGYPNNNGKLTNTVILTVGVKVFENNNV